MATVTMTGTEFAELLHKEQQLEEILKYVDTCCRVHVPDSGKYAYTEKPELPTWVKQRKLQKICTSILQMPGAEFKIMVDSGEHYYCPNRDDFHTYCCDGAYDLLADKAIQARWKAVQDMEAAAEAAEDDHGVEVLEVGEY